MRTISRDYARQQWLSAEVAAAANEHLRGCAGCRQVVEGERVLSGQLAALGEEWKAEGAPARVEAALLAAFDGQQKRRKVTLGWWAAPVAAAALVGAFLAGTRQGGEMRVVEQSPVAMTTAAPVVEARPVMEAPVVEQGKEAAAAPRVRYTTAPRERTTEFLPLRYGKPVETGEVVSVLRMQIPRGELARLGLPVSPEAASGLVKADVLIGEDGLAKAIRFIY